MRAHSAPTHPHSLLSRSTNLARLAPPAGPSPRMGPSHPPLADDIQFSMDFEDEAAGTGTTIAPRTFESEGASHKKADNALAPARSRSVGHSQRDSRRSSLDASAERAEKKPRISASGSAGATPMSISPLIGPAAISPPLSSTLVPLDADVQPTTVIRDQEFQSGRRVFHVHFGHGYVVALERQVPAGSSEQPELEHTLTSRTHNIKVVFDNPKYSELRLRAFYAVPKMVVVPSSSALQKRKIRQLHRFEIAGASAGERITHVKEILATGGSLRLACGLISRWSLQHAFDVSGLLKRLVDRKDYSSAVRFAREFNLRKDYPTSQLLHGMLEEKRYDGVLKACNSACSVVEGDVKPTDVLRMMVRAGNHGVALKYVHKFQAMQSFPPDELVKACLQAKGELCVRTAVMLFKYVKLFKLEETFPRATLLERVSASGILVLETSDGKLFCKGRRRHDTSQDTPSAPLKVGSAPV